MDAVVLASFFIRNLSSACLSVDMNWKTGNIFLSAIDLQKY